MMRSLFSGVSGLKNHQTRMDVIGNNISNVNTTGFKSSRVTFVDTLQQTLTGASLPTDNLGGTNPKQIGLGSGIGSIDMIMTDGSVQSTGKNTDLCLSGNGYFVVKNGNDVFYTRNGAFEFDANGNYVLPGSGLYVQGWMADEATGKITTGKTLDSLENIQIEIGKSMEPKATTTATYSKNLNASEPVIVSASGGTKIHVVKIYRNGDGGRVQASSVEPVTLTFGDGSTRDVVTGVYKVGDNYTATINTPGAISPIVSDIWSVTDIKLGNGKVEQGTTGNKYTIGEKFGTFPAAAGDIFTANANNIVNFTTMNGDTFNNVISGAYYLNRVHNYPLNTVGDDVTINTGNTSAKVTLADGTVFNGVNTKTYTVGSSTTVDYDSTTELKRATKSTANTMSIVLANGSSYTPVNGETYEIGQQMDPLDPTSTIKTMTLTADVSSLHVSSRINTLNEEPKIIEYTESAVIQQMEQTEEHTVATPEKPVVVTLSDGSNYTETSGSYRVGESLPIATVVTAYDTLGIPHKIPVFLKKKLVYSGEADPVTGEVGDGNVWSVSINTNGIGENVIIEDDGSISTIKMEDANICFDTLGKYREDGSTRNIALSLFNGSNPENTVFIDVSGLTQYAGSNTVAVGTDGYAEGRLNSVAIDSSGVITGTYSNGLTRQEAQVALAQFANPSGLEKKGSSLYKDSNNSGREGGNAATTNAIPNFSVGTAGELGVTITPSALEMSNVDIANEFSDMIITQRGFQVNSKIITVSDEMLETLVNMKR